MFGSAHFTCRKSEPKPYEKLMASINVMLGGKYFKNTGAMREMIKLNSFNGLHAVA